MADNSNKSAGSLLGDLARQIPELFRNELKLFRAEIGEKTNQAFGAVGMIVAAVVVGLVALNVLAAALVAAIANAGVSAGWAAVIVGGAFAIIALILVMKGVSDLKAANLAPSKTVRAVSRDAHTAKEKTR